MGISYLKDMKKPLYSEKGEIGSEAYIKPSKQYKVTKFQSAEKEFIVQEFSLPKQNSNSEELVNIVAKKEEMKNSADIIKQIIQNPRIHPE
jgi:hypothetical protein